MFLDRQVEAPAKINLSLRVRARRADGYHELDSLFVPLSLSDHLHVRCEPSTSLEIHCRCPGRPELDGDANLAARAARRLLERCGVCARVEIAIEKRIWLAAGLGGGSSDAAAVLQVLAGALGEAAPHREQLAALALELGADVPFFLDPRPTRAQGIGELLTPLEGLPPLQLVLANPAMPVSTAEVYRGLGLMPGEQRKPPDQPTRVAQDLSAIAALMVNDLEPVARRLCPRVEDLERELCRAGALAASMSGSGPTVFGVFPDEATAARAAERLARKPATLALHVVGWASHGGTPD